MNERTEQMANEAIFTLQFNTREAVRYVQRNANATEKEAQTAIKAVTTFHKQSKQVCATA
jgi:hypothetical protein